MHVQHFARGEWNTLRVATASLYKHLRVYRAFVQALCVCTRLYFIRMGCASATAVRVRVASGSTYAHVSSGALNARVVHMQHFARREALCFVQAVLSRRQFEYCIAAVRRQCISQHPLRVEITCTGAQCAWRVVPLLYACTHWLSETPHCNV